MEPSRVKPKNKWDTIKNISILFNAIGLIFLFIDVAIDNEPKILGIMPMLLFTIGVPLSFLADYFVRKTNR
ncbi:hypothetical protein [Salinibacillus xinjiangensis]|uniref:Uncharacterized protein n=1 Tax=Salinibacillus xinjiangensis TaxID=1229268 RepID=A0A6G1XAW1_9BACI|nr:hypothetical protein [Salinibacillus xinjiangensis]MRG88077.1 hypothetical protein [Salinibacillus xinjiangensis]